ncbi:MAG TPA: hypothetical protein VHK90_13635 [Thermoanaerobaculia bacterium]|nr:hypothetical protein [Thermoanaerobaculia bacterium]
MRALALSLALVLLASCNGESDPTSPDGPVPFTEVAKQNSTGIRTRRAEIISRESRWIEVWDEITATQSPKPPRPQVNFETQILILAAYGETGDACRDVQIEKVDRRSGVLEVSILDKRREPNCAACPAIVVQPVHVVSVARAATGASYTWRVTTQPCT